MAMSRCEVGRCFDLDFSVRTTGVSPYIAEPVLRAGGRHPVGGDRPGPLEGLGHGGPPDRRRSAMEPATLRDRYRAREPRGWCGLPHRSSRAYLRPTPLAERRSRDA